MAPRGARRCRRRQGSRGSLPTGITGPLPPPMASATERPCGDVLPTVARRVAAWRLRRGARGQRRRGAVEVDERAMALAVQSPPWRTVDEVEPATLRWVHWQHRASPRRLQGPATRRVRGPVHPSTDRRPCGLKPTAGVSTEPRAVHIGDCLRRPRTPQARSSRCSSAGRSRSSRTQPVCSRSGWLPPAKWQQTSP
jgi:hypothetical protein